MLKQEQKLHRLFKHVFNRGWENNIQSNRGNSVSFKDSFFPPCLSETEFPYFKYGDWNIHYLELLFKTDFLEYLFKSDDNGNSIWLNRNYFELDVCERYSTATTIELSPGTYAELKRMELTQKLFEEDFDWVDWLYEHFYDYIDNDGVERFVFHI